MEWAGVKNGELLKLAEARGYTILLTADRNVAYQQNLRNRPIALICLTALDWEINRHYLDQINVAMDAALPASFQVIECGESRRT